jgi:hypothetical protein
MSVNLAQAYAERKQAANMIEKRVYMLLAVARAIKKGRLPDVYKMLSPFAGSGILPRKKKVLPSADNLANYWLEYQYGWRPLLSDIYGATEAIVKASLDRYPIVFTGSATSEKLDVGKLVRLCTVAGSGSFREIADMHYRETSRYVIRAEMDDSGRALLSQTGISNPLLLAWELLPYSFVIDWFIPVGDYVKQLDYASGWQFKSGTFSVKRTGIGTSYMKPPSPLLSNWVISNWTGYQGGGALVAKQRVVLGSFPHAKIPTFAPKLGIERITSGVALLTQLFTSGKTSRR